MRITELKAVPVRFPDAPPSPAIRRPSWNDLAPRGLPLNKYADFPPEALSRIEIARWTGLLFCAGSRLFFLGTLTRGRLLRRYIDINKALSLATRVRSGQVYVNTYGAGGGVELPFGGYKKSGYGREKGLEALHSYTQVKNVCVKFA